MTGGWRIYAFVFSFHVEMCIFDTLRALYGKYTHHMPKVTQSGPKLIPGWPQRDPKVAQSPAEAPPTLPTAPVKNSTNSKTKVWGREWLRVPPDGRLADFTILLLAAAGSTFLDL